MFYPEKHVTENMYHEPDYGYVHSELRKTGVTLKLLWQEYQAQCSSANFIPMGYTKYCIGYDSYTTANRLASHIEHKPGIITEVDWSGPTMSYVDTSTGEFIKAYLFVATLPLPLKSKACQMQHSTGFDKLVENRGIEPLTS